MTKTCNGEKFSRENSRETHEARLAEVEEPTLGCLAALDWDEDTE